MFRQSLRRNRHLGVLYYLRQHAQRQPEEGPPLGSKQLAQADVVRDQRPHDTESAASLCCPAVKKTNKCSIRKAEERTDVAFWVNSAPARQPNAIVKVARRKLCEMLWRRTLRLTKGRIIVPENERLRKWLLTRKRT